MYNREKGAKLMILILNRLKQMENFSDSEVKIAQYILKNPKDTITMSIHELAKNNYSSAPTITRFCKKIGVEGFAEFKVELAKEISISTFSSTRIEDDLPFTSEDSFEEVANNILNLNIQSMLDTYNHINIDHLVKIANQLARAKSIMMYGIGQSLILCEDFQYKLLRIGYNVTVANQIGYGHMQAYSLPSDSVVLMISYYANNEANLEIASALRSQGIPIILITGPYDTALTKIANEVIKVPSHEGIMRKMASYSSRSAIQLIIDILYAIIFSLDYNSNKEIVTQNY